MKQIIEAEPRNGARGQHAPAISEHPLKRGEEVQELEGVDLTVVASLLIREAGKNLNRLIPGRTIGATIFSSGTPPSPWTVDVIYPYATILSRKDDLNDAEVISISTAHTDEADGQKIMLPTSISRTDVADPLAPPSTAYEAAVKARDVMVDLFSTSNDELDSILFGEGTAENHSVLSLSPRQTEVLSLVAKGLSNPKIAQELHISVQTVKNHLSSVFKITNTNSRLEAAVLAHKHGLISL